MKISCLNKDNIKDSVCDLPICGFPSGKLESYAIGQDSVKI